MSETIIGAHIKRHKTIVATFEELRTYSGDGPVVLQIFVCNPRSGRITEGHFQKYAEEATKTALKTYMRSNNCRLWIHSPYTFNIARAFTPDAYWVTTTIKQLQMADIIGADGVILHIGHATTQGYDKSVTEMKKTINYILTHYKGRSKLVLETASGMGTELLADLRLLRDFVRDVADSRLKICIDTAHVWAVGYEPIEAIRFVGRSQLAIVHFNNTPTMFGNRVDRHECLRAKTAQIPMETMQNVARLCGRWKIPLVMETPRDCWRKEIILFRENRATNT